MENLVGKKMKGFEFRENEFLEYRLEMDDFKGKIGKIFYNDSILVTVDFGTSKTFSYPLPEALEHIVQEEPTIPELGESVLMEVSHDGENWFKQYMIAKYKEKYISNLLVSYTHVRPIQPKKLTMEELEELVGGKFEIVK